MHNNSDFPILVAGAGLCGLTTACALHQMGFTVEVYERAAEPRGAENVGLRLWSNAVTMLTKLGLFHRVRAAGTPIEKFELRNSNGQLVSESSIARLAREVGAPSIAIRHSALINILKDACADIPIHFGSNCVGYTLDNGYVGLRLEGGGEVPAALVIGADGVRSAIRAQLVGDDPPSYTGHTIWQGMCQDVGELEKGTLYTVWGPHNLHAGCWYVDENHVAWFIRADAPEFEQYPTGVAKGRAQGLVDQIRGPLGHLVELTAPEHIRVSKVYSHVHSAFRRLDPVVLVGDAAHAMPDVFGQTVSQTIEDGMFLAQSLASAPDMEVGLASFESRRLPRIHWVREQIYRFDTVNQADRPILLWMQARAARVLGRDTSSSMWRQFVTLPD